MKAEFTMHVEITDRQVILTTDTNNMQGVDASLAIKIFSTMEGTRNRIKQQIDKYYGDEDINNPEKNPDMQEQTAETSSE